jgi:sialate O-acetylesterase
MLLRFAAFAGAVLLAMPVHGEQALRLPTLISDNAMFQSDKPVAIWGWAEPGSHLKVVFETEHPDRGESFTATTGADGRWSGYLPPLKSGSEGQLSVTTDRGGRQLVNHVLFGEVWLGGGQSNMEYDLAGTGRTDMANLTEVSEVAQNVANAQREADSSKPPIRYFKVAFLRAQQPMDDVKGTWILVDSSNVSRLSAVAWNFAVALHNKLHVPVGLIVSSVGNTPIEAWVSKQTLEATSVGHAVEERSALELAGSTPEKIAEYQARLNTWNAANPTPQMQSQNQASKPAAPNLSASNYVPSQYYNGMILGLEPYTIRGIIWYQGSGNFQHPSEYAEMFKALILEWRQDWKDTQLPFYFVEESNFQQKQTQPVEENPFSIIREQQHAALTLPNAGMICSVDLGNGNPHYPNKKPVGERLAHLALHDVYHFPGQVESPLFNSFAVEGSKIRLHFTNAEGFHLRDGSELKGFAIRGADGKWVWAKGEIVGKDIMVWSDHVAAPIAVRYAWAVNPIASVVNVAGLPLFPFRTDTERAK